MNYFAEITNKRNGVCLSLRNWKWTESRVSCHMELKTPYICTLYSALVTVMLVDSTGFND